MRGGGRVLLVDRADPGRATDAGAGILSPETSFRYPPGWFAFAKEAVRYYPFLLEDLRADREEETGYARCGLVIVASSEDERPAFERARAQIFAGQEDSELPSEHVVREISADHARRLFPPLGDVVGAIYHRDAARVDGRLLAGSIRSAAERRGLATVRGGVERLILTGGRVAGAVVDGNTLSAPRVAITGGAWSAAFGAQLGIQIAVEPQRGQIIHLGMGRTETAGWTIILGFRDHYMVPWPGGRVVAGATRETGSGFDPRPTVAGVREVLAEALRVAPGLSEAEVLEIRVGLRPLSSDGLPVLGAVPGAGGVYLATGHGPTGLQLGPYSGKVVADLMLGREPGVDLAPFRPGRFQRRA